jgi:hypothetical protein
MGNNMKIKYEITAEKFIEDKVEGEYITRKYHRLNLSPEEVANVMWWAEYLDYGDDPETDWSRGMYSSSPDADLDFIDMSKLIPAIEEYLEDNGKDMWEDDELATINNEFDQLKKYREYQLTIHEREDK